MDGGGIYNNSGTLTVDHGTITCNTTTESGGVANFGTLTLNHIKVRHDSAPLGGDLYNNAGLVSLIDSIISGRYDV